MIPNRVIIRGFKRFKNVNVCLDRQLLALVGANEAGKSSFLEALTTIENNKPYNATELTQDLELLPTHQVVTVLYLLNKTEIEELTQFNGVGTPRFFKISKDVSGKFTYDIIGKISRNTTIRSRLSITILNIIKKKTLNKVLENNFIPNAIPNTKLPEICLGELLRNIESGLSKDIDNIPQELRLNCQKIIELLDKDLKYLNKQSFPIFEELADRVEKFLDVESEQHPHELFLKFCQERRPIFTIFSNDQRFLKNIYPLTELKVPTKALLNLLLIAKVELPEYLKAIQKKDYPKLSQFNDQANSLLKQTFSSAWCQSEVYPRLSFDPDSIKINIVSSNNYTWVTSRSDGLKQFIALMAFLSLRNHKIPPVLMIDEAEIHLHYAAQADLIQEFESQKLVNSIIYTTHSAGCLPSDLGTGIRGVEQIRKAGKDTGYSTIRNSIWKNTGGFSPILLAMGANIIAFTLARKAIIAEGPSETILLPRLFREAIQKDYLEFQVAPGIATISKEKALTFELEAAKIVYLVDGDKGGTANKRKLKSAGIAENKIFQLFTDCSLEDYVEANVLFNAVNVELKKSGKQEILIKKIPPGERLQYLISQCKKQGVEISKVRISENIAKIPSDEKILDNEMKVPLQLLYQKIMAELN